MNDNDNLILLVALGTTITVLLSGSLIFFVVFYQRRMLQKKLEAQQAEVDHQKRLLQANITSQETERKRIASELHDGVGAMLSATKLNLGMLNHLSLDERDEVISESKDMLDETIETVRRISKDLLPASLEKFGLAKALEELCNKLSNSQVHISFTQYEEPQLSEKPQELMTYRIVQECINNALKYSGSEKIEVVLSATDVTVTDYGKGFDPFTLKKDISTGVGIYNMENRANLLGGKLIIDSAPNKGTQVTLTL